MNKVILSDLREALEATEHDAVADRELAIVWAAAKAYEPLVDSFVEFATETGDRINRLVNLWMDRF